MRIFPKTNAWMLSILIVSLMITSCNKGEPPVANFSSDMVEAVTGQDITFTDLSSNDPTSWEWNFGDGNTSMDRNRVR